jgi:hypothetical protein
MSAHWAAAIDNHISSVTVTAEQIIDIRVGGAFDLLNVVSGSL